MSTSHTHIRVRFRRAAMAAAGITLLSAVPAAAESAVFADARGDMSGLGADIHRVRVVNEDRIRVRVVHDDLVRSWRSGSSLAVFFDTDRSRKGPEYVFLGGTFEGADYALVEARGWKAASRTAVPMQCGYDMALDYRADVAAIRIDRDCLGDPGAIRVEVKTGAELDDDPSDQDSVRDWLGEPRSFTPWVAHG